MFEISIEIIVAVGGSPALQVGRNASGAKQHDFGRRGARNAALSITRHEKREARLFTLDHPYSISPSLSSLEDRGEVA